MTPPDVIQVSTPQLGALLIATWSKRTAPLALAFRRATDRASRDHARRALAAHLANEPTGDTVTPAPSRHGVPDRWPNVPE